MSPHRILGGILSPGSGSGSAWSTVAVAGLASCKITRPNLYPKIGRSESGDASTGAARPSGPGKRCRRAQHTHTTNKEGVQEDGQVCARARVGVCKRGRGRVWRTVRAGDAGVMEIGGTGGLPCSKPRPQSQPDLPGRTEPAASEVGAGSPHRRTPRTARSAAARSITTRTLPWSVSAPSSDPTRVLAVSQLPCRCAPGAEQNFEAGIVHRPGDIVCSSHIIQHR